MRISIFGMGYVGTVSGICLASRGHHVIGVDLNPIKVALINQGTCPIIEKDLPDMLNGLSGTGTLRATSDVEEAIRNSDLSFICVGTPGNGNGNQDLTSIRRVSEQIGTVLQDKNDRHTIVVRSTLLPGTTEGVVIPSLECAAKKTAGKDFSVFFHPEFMREGNSVHDFFNPAISVIGGPDGEGLEKMFEIYEWLKSPIIRTGYRVAETIKYVSNAFHALKIAFANEIGAICKAMEIDSHEVMEIVCLDRRLNISSAYLTPGFAFGGSCLPKDIRALNYRAKELDLETPLLQAVLPANLIHAHRALDLVYRYGRKKIGIIGLSFKAGTDDLRESPMVMLAETLIGKGYPLRIYDRNIYLSGLTGSNKDYIEREIPHIASLLVSDLTELYAWSDLIILGSNEEDLRPMLPHLKNEHIVIDLARAFDARQGRGCPVTYHGVCW